MKAKRGSTLVYTERGFEAERSLDLPEDKAVGGHAGQTCPHGGPLLFGVPVCAYCGDPEEQLGLGILYIARKVSKQVRGVTFDDNDVIGAVAIALHINSGEICRAKNPTALAFLIGLRAARKLYRHPGGIKTFATEEAGLELAASRTEMSEDWNRQCFEAVRSFPGVDQVWNPANFDLLHRTIEEAKQSLPTEPFDVWKIIDLRLGLTGRDHYWGEIAKMLNEGVEEPISARDLGRIYDFGLASIRAHLVKKLCPIATWAPNGNE